ncbi:G-protein coupled receptor 4-like [Parambassis ranga]|uniref:G-protein coupled receptor 4-like n=1 Tax=Parambassis ranga TaxID=210632 RepID=A0A6P7JVJ4_9TELE|nr:G-protein coupled receptor 4-like [Parambassis ranga]
MGKDYNSSITCFNENFTYACCDSENFTYDCCSYGNYSSYYCNNGDFIYDCCNGWVFVFDCNFEQADFATFVLTCIIICIGLPLTLVSIYSVYFTVRKDNIAPIYVINLFISDLIQLCSMIVWVAEPKDWKIYEIFFYIYYLGVMASVGFMVCVALERYLVIAWPLWYHNRKTIKSSLVVCIVVWSLPVIYLVLPLCFWVSYAVADTMFAAFLLIPFPLFIFFLVGTLRALSSARSVPSDEKRRIVAILVVALLIYTLLFLPSIIWSLAEEASYNCVFSHLTFILLQLSPLADLIMYVFIRKGAIDKLLTSLCCSKVNSDEITRTTA